MIAPREGGKLFFVLGAGFTAEEIEVGDNLAGRAAKGLRLYLEGKVLDAEAGIVASDTDPGVVYIFDPNKGKMMKAYLITAPNGEKAYRKTEEPSLGYLDGYKHEVRYDSHDFARMFAQDVVVRILSTPKSDEAIRQAIEYAEADDAGRKRILDAYDHRRAEFKADRQTGKAEFKARQRPVWDNRNAGCAKMEELWAGKAWPISVTVQRNGTRQVLKASNPAHARAAWAWTFLHGWVPTGEIKEAIW